MSTIEVIKATGATSRLEARITPELHAAIKRAADLQGRTVSDFVIDIVGAAAYQVIETHSLIRLALADQERIANALLSPPKPNAALKRAFERRNKLLRPE
jgi:uncharacterized protein (DUF1778 family)